MSVPPAKPWSHADLFFLSNALRQGMSVEEVAGFLSRTLEEVRAKAQALHLQLNKSRRIERGARLTSHAEMAGRRCRAETGPGCQRSAIVSSGGGQWCRPTAFNLNLTCSAVWSPPRQCRTMLVTAPFLRATISLNAVRKSACA